MIRTHLENKAEATIAALPVRRGRGHGRAGSCGSTPAAGSSTSRRSPRPPRSSTASGPTPTGWPASASSAEGRPYLASMGIYLFNRADARRRCSPRAAPPTSARSSSRRRSPTHRVQAHLFDGYWEDIGTVGAFHKANIDLTRDNPPFDFTFGDHPIFTRPRYLPCSRIAGATVTNSLISDGCVIGRGSVIENSVIGVRAQIADDVTIRNSLHHGDRQLRAGEAPRRQPPRPAARTSASGPARSSRTRSSTRTPGSAAACGSPTRRGSSTRRRPPHYVIRDKIVVIPKYTILQDRTVI